MSKSLIPLDTDQNTSQHTGYEHVAHMQLQQHITAVEPAQRAARTERIQLLLAQSEVEAVDEFRFTNRCASRSDAIRILLQRGLSAGHRKPVEEPADVR